MIRSSLKSAALAGAILLSSALTVSAQQVKLSATLNGGEEAPNKVSTGASGTVQVNVDQTAKEITVNMRIYNVPVGTTASHIHVGAPDVAGPIIFDLVPPVGTTGDFSLDIRLSSAHLIPRAAQGILTMDDAIQALVTGNTYINLHTTSNPAGEIRGQLR